MSDEAIRKLVQGVAVPTFRSTAFTRPPPLAEATVAIVTTAGLRTLSDPPWESGDQSFRSLSGKERKLTLGHRDQNFDRVGIAADLNVVYPVDRLQEMASEGVIAGVAPRHISFMGALDATMTTIRLDTGPSAAGILREDGVDVVLLTPV